MFQSTRGHTNAVVLEFGDISENGAEEE